MFYIFRLACDFTVRTEKMTVKKVSENLMRDRYLQCIGKEELRQSMTRTVSWNGSTCSVRVRNTAVDSVAENSLSDLVHIEAKQ